MKRKTLLTYTVLLTALAAAGAVVHGRLTDRWGGCTEQLQAAAATLKLAPREFGNWKLFEELELTDREKGILGCESSWNRRYVHKSTGQVVAVVMICGPPGPTSSHYPGLCYSSQGFEAQLDTAERFFLEFPGNKSHEFFENSFLATGLSAQKLQVCYAWRQGDRWLAPAIPRVTFGGGAFLYKIQLAAHHTRDIVAGEGGPCREFLREFIPALEKTVFKQPAE